MKSGFHRSILTFSMLMLLASLSGCTNNGPMGKPTTDKMVSESANRVRQFVDQAGKSKKDAKLKENLAIMMESLEAEASEYGGSSEDILKAAKEFQSLLETEASQEQITAGLEEFKSQIDKISPAG